MIAVVGASGYLGGALHEAAKRCGPVLGTSRTGGPFLRLSLDEPERFRYEAIRKGDTVCVTAGISSPDVCSREPERARRVNVEGTSAVISNVLATGARVIFFSTDAVYGEREDEFDESASCRPKGEYAVMKREVESLFAEEENFKTIRLSLVFSYHDRFTTYVRGCAKRKEGAEIFHPFIRSVVYLGDVTQGTIALARRWRDIPRKAVNFGGPAAVTRIEFAELLRETALSNLRIRATDPGCGFFGSRPRSIRMKSPVLASLLGRPPRSLRDAVRMEFNRAEPPGPARPRLA